MDLTSLASEVGTLEGVLVLARECGFGDVVVDIQHDIATELLPATMMLVCLSDGPSGQPFPGIGGVNAFRECNLSPLVGDCRARSARTASE
jgi:hypothetical protein